MDRTLLNERLAALAAEFGVSLRDDDLDDLTHTVADVLEAHMGTWTTVA